MSRFGLAPKARLVSVEVVTTPWDPFLPLAETPAATVNKIRAGLLGNTAFQIFRTSFCTTTATAPAPGRVMAQRAAFGDATLRVKPSLAGYEVP